MTQTLVISLVVLAVIAVVLQILKVQKAEKIRMQNELEEMYPKETVKIKTPISEAIAVEAPVVVVDQEVVVPAKPKKRRKYKPKNSDKKNI